jgi:hypothetical protein
MSQGLPRNANIYFCWNANIVCSTGAASSTLFFFFFACPNKLIDFEDLMFKNNFKNHIPKYFLQVSSFFFHKN